MSEVIAVVAVIAALSGIAFYIKHVIIDDVMKWRN